MRKLICDKSYMDEILPKEISINFDNEDSESVVQNIKKLELYYDKYMLTEKWHKRAKKDDLPILIKNDQKNLLYEEMLDYYSQLKNFYFYTMIDSNNRRIVRLNRKREESLSDDEYRLYLKELRIHDEEIDNLDDLESRKKRVPVLRTLMRANKVLAGIKVYHLNVDMPENPDNRPIIFAFSHVGRNDQIVFSSFIKNHYLVLSGDYESMHNCVEGVVTRKNGAIFFDMNSVKERKEITDRVADKLKEGYNILCSMEAAWNLYANIPVQEVFDGMCKAAIPSNALILPVAIEMFDERLFGVNISEEFIDPLTYDCSNFNSDKEMFRAMAGDYRNKLADLKLQLYFEKNINKKIQEKRVNIGNYETYNRKFKKKILKGWTFSEEDIDRKRYHGREQPIYVFQYLVEKYNSIFPLCEEIKNDKIDLYDKVKNLKRVKILLLELLEDLENPVYPNDIINQLKDIYFQLSAYLNNLTEINDEFKDICKLLK